MRRKYTIYSLLASWTLMLAADANLVAWWRLDGNFEDSSDNGIHGEAIGEPTFATEVKEDIGGQSLRLGAGDGQGVSLPAYPLLNTNLFTLGMFINQDGAVQGGAGLERLTSREADSFETAIGDAGVLPGQEQNGISQLSYYSPVTGWTATGVTVPAEGWVHVVWRNGAASMDLFVDGELLFSGQPVTVAPGTMNLGVRVNTGPVEGFEGLIDDVFLWDDAENPLTEDDIMDIADRGMVAFLGLDIDSDGDGLPDAFEEGCLDPFDNGDVDPDNGAAGDPDEDGLDNAGEFAAGTDPCEADSDGDELSDGDEVEAGTSPTRRDTDGDGLEDGQEVETGTNPTDPDSDGDGFLDGFEVTEGSDPLDDTSTPDPSSSLVLHLDFEENVNDQSGNGHDGALLGSATYSEDSPAVLGGRSLSLDNNAAEDAGVEIQGDPELGANPFTLAYWIKPASPQEGTAGLERLTSRAGDSFETAIGDAGAVGGTTSPTGITLSYYQGGWNVTNVEIREGEWVHVAWVNRPEGIELYLDGELAYNGSAVPPARPGSGLMRIGTRHNNVEGFEGAMDDLRLYSIALSSDQVAELAGGGGAGFQFSITEIALAPDKSQVSITFASRPGRIYAIDFSNDGVLWQELDDSVPSDGDSTTYVDETVPVLSPDVGLYRVREF